MKLVGCPAPTDYTNIYGSSLYKQQQEAKGKKELNQGVKEISLAIL
jgi:hypothetical protein